MNNIEDGGELPGLMIEEMMESASLVQGGQEEGMVKESEEKVGITYMIFILDCDISSSAESAWLRGGRGQ